jgi:hypothetical protein
LEGLTAKPVLKDLVEWLEIRLVDASPCMAHAFDDPILKVAERTRIPLAPLTLGALPPTVVNCEAEKPV